VLAAIFRRARRLHLLTKSPQGVVDSTGLETHHVSSHFIRCTKRDSYRRRCWTKWAVVRDTRTHLIAACVVHQGPRYDFRDLPRLMADAHKHVRFAQILADSGYDSEDNPCFCRQTLEMGSTVIACNRRGRAALPTGKYRRQMVQHFARKTYGNLWQVESVFSRNKRLLGSALRARSNRTRRHECYIRVLTHNLMILRRVA
jgi:hypothetical protein